MSDTIDFADLYLPSPDGTKKVTLSVKIIRSSSREGDFVSQYIRFCKAATEMRRKNKDDLNLAIKELTEYCLSNNILAEFIKEHENEVYTMMDTLFNQERVTEIHEKNLMWESYNDGKVKGRAEGENKIITLINSLINAGRNDEIQKVTSDAEYRQKLYTEFRIE